jgi:5'-methylthioadenosine phosphorylase
MNRIGIIGGSGLDNPDILENPSNLVRETVWGLPSGPLKLGTIDGIEVVIISRHGREHTIPPTQVNFRANIQALKDLGCTCILATTAVGSLREDIHRGDFVIIDQFIDFTKRRAMSFYEAFEANRPVHSAMADPFDPHLRGIMVEVCRRKGFAFHPSGTVVTIEGPRFSTRAESRMFRAWGADIINMSIATEVILANEAGIPYAAVAMSTDYDCWKEDEEAVSWEAVMAVFKGNVEKVTSLLVAAISQISSVA